MQYGTLNLARTSKPGKNRIIYQIETPSGENIVIIQDVYEIRDGQTRLAITAPSNVKILRGELATNSAQG